MEDQYDDKPLALIQYNSKTQKFEVGQEAIEFIRKVPQPIGVIAVAGTYRTGKSYLLNRMLLNQSDGFGVGPTINPCTKGLWIWGRPVLGQMSNGKPINVLIIDSEGIGSLSAETNHDSRIFSLALLLCSQFIYNSTGSIDENALEQLSLIIHLTKNIQIYADKNKQDIDQNDYAKYFPHFLWVLRDFTLQLVDEDGESITSKEYLEKALQLQKGFTDGIENKNRIRRLLSTFFSERDCHTLVRPLTDEDSLQHLEKLQMDELRPEFFEQVIQLRRKLLNRMHPKILNGKLLNGSMLADLCQTYCKAINEGAVPNIESAWTYICKNECHKACQKALEKYEVAINDLLHNKLPLPHDQLKQYHKMAKHAAKDYFYQKAVGEISKEYKIDLNKKIKQHFSIITQQNKKECEVNKFLINLYLFRDNYQSIEAKLRNNEYGEYKEYLDDMEMFQSYLFENSPLGPERNAIISQHLLKFIEEASEWFMKYISQELDVQNNLKDDLEKQLSVRIDEIREEQLQEKQKYLKKVQQLEAQQQEMIAKEQIMKDTVKTLKLEKQQNEDTLQTQLSHCKQQMKHNEESLRNQVSAQEEQFQDLERKQLLHGSEHDKEKALLLQKVQFYENQLNEQTAKDKLSFTEIKNVKKEHQCYVSDMQKRYETQTKELQHKIDDLQDQIAQLQNDMTQQQHTFYKEKSDWYQKERNMKKTLDDTKQNLAVLQQNQKNMQTDQSFEVIKEDYEERLSEAKQKIKAYEIQFQKQEETMLQNNQEISKSKAILVQKIKFLELELNDTKDQLEEQKNSNSLIMNAFDFPTTGGVDETQLAELEDKFQKELSEQKNEFNKTQAFLQQQIQSLTEYNSQVEFKMKIATDTHQSNITSLEEKIGELENQRIQLIERNKALEKQKFSALSASENKYGDISEQHETELEQLSQQQKFELMDMQTKNEEQLAQLKSLQQAERDRLEQRNLISEEKRQKQQQIMEEEFNAKTNEANQMHEDEVDNLQSDLLEKNNEMNTCILEFDHEMSLKEQQLLNQELQIEDLKKSLAESQNIADNKLEQQSSQFQEEKQQLQERIDRFTKDLQVKDKQAYQNQQQIDSLSHAKKKLTEKLNNVEEEYNEQSMYLESQYKQSEKERSSQSSSHLREKIDLERDLALATQQKSFLEKKIKDMNSQLKQERIKYEEKIKQMKGELSMNMLNRINTLQEDKSNLEIKYEKVLRDKKNIEQTYGKKVIELEREKAVRIEKLNHLEAQIEQNSINFQQETESLNEKLCNHQENKAAQIQELKKNLKELKYECSCKDSELIETKSTLEKERELNEEKFKFLTAQKNQARNSQKEYQNKFEIMINQYQKRRLAEIKEKEQQRKAQINQLENRHQKVLEEKSQHIAQLQRTHQQQIESLKAQLQELKDQIVDKSRNNSKVSDLIDKITGQKAREQQLKVDLEESKDEYEKAYKNYEEKLNLQKLGQKKRIQDLDNQYKISQSKIQNLVYEHEKKRMHWNLEKDNYINQVNNITDELKRYKTKNQQLVKENEKYKADAKQIRRSSRTNAHQSNLYNSGFKGGFSMYTSKYRNRSNHNSRRTINLKTSEASFISKVSDVEEIGPSNNYILGDINFNKGQPKPPKMPKKYIGDKSYKSKQFEDQSNEDSNTSLKLNDFLGQQSPGIQDKSQDQYRGRGQYQSKE